MFLADVEIVAADAESEPKSGPRRFSVRAYNGGPLQVSRWDTPVVVDLKGLQMGKSVIANLHHDTTQIVGHVDAHNNDGKQLTLEGSVSGTGPAAEEFQANHDNGFPWQASIEAKPLVVTEVAEGQSIVVNGQKLTGPLQIASKSKLHGIAFVPHGADEDTAVTVAASAADSVPEREIDMKFHEWIKAKGFDPEKLDDRQKSYLQEQYDAEIAAADDGVIVKATPAPFDIDALKASYAKHESDIEAKLFEYKGKVDDVKLAEIKASAYETAIKLKQNALQQERSAEQFELEAIKAASNTEVALIRAERPTGPAIHASEKDINGEVIEAALCMNLGLNVEKDYREETLEAAHRGFRRLGLQEVLILAANANGYQGRNRITPDNLREVLQCAFMPSIQASAFSTVSLSGIMSNVANKELLEGFMEEDQSWREVAEIKSVSDFKTVTSYRMLDDMEYQKLGPNGEIAHGKLGEESFTRSADTYAKMFAITRQQIINDDLGALDDLRTRLGRGAARKFRRLFWETFLANSSFFTSARGNYIDGATTTLLVDGVGLQLAITAYRKLKSGDKKQVGKATSLGAPDRLVVPPELEFAAQRLYQSTQVNTGGAATAESVGNANIHAGKYRPIVVNELSDSDYTGNSSTGWYLFGSILKPIVVSFLNGIENPTVESADADFNQLGVQFRGYHDFGVNRTEWLSGVKSKGAA